MLRAFEFFHFVIAASTTSQEIVFSVGGSRRVGEVVMSLEASRWLHARMRACSHACACRIRIYFRPHGSLRIVQACCAIRDEAPHFAAFRKQPWLHRGREIPRHGHRGVSYCRIHIFAGAVA